MLEACKKTVMALTTGCNSSLHAEVESLAALCSGETTDVQSGTKSVHLQEHHWPAGE